MRSPALLLIFALAAVAPAATIDQYLSGPFASGLSAAPSGGKVIWLLNERAARKLGEGRSPAVSKDGQVAFLRNGQIFLTNFAGDKTSEIVHTKGRSGELRWSPDGTQLAFINTRTDHSFIGVWRVADQSVHYLDPSVDRDSFPAWSVDSRRIAFLRQPAAGGRGGGPVRTARAPWSIRVAHVATGTGPESLPAHHA